MNFFICLKSKICFYFIHHLLFYLLVFNFSIFSQAQESANTAGGDISGSGGSVAYSIGQVVYTTHSGSLGIVAKGVQQSYEIAEVFSALELALVQTPWSKMPSLPTMVDIQTTEGQYVRVGVNWNLSALDVYKRGMYTISGSLNIPSILTNPKKVISQLRIQVLAKDPPRDLSLSNVTFSASPESFIIPVGEFSIEDPIDTVHEIRFFGKGYDNGFFEIKRNSLFWNSIDPAPGKKKFTILMQVTDRDGNTLEKFFEIIRKLPETSSLIISNTFTPNGDGANDTWGIPDLRFLQQARIQIFDRGGILVFYTENPDMHWDGKVNGKDAPTGSYFWGFSVKETGETRRGILNLLRK